MNAEQRKEADEFLATLLKRAESKQCSINFALTLAFAKGLEIGATSAGLPAPVSPDMEETCRPTPARHRSHT